jgi:copper resistance protein D
MFEPLSVAAIYAATLATIGSAAAVWLLQLTSLATLAVRRVALVSALSLWALMLVRLIAHSIAVFGLPEGLTRESLWTIAIQSRWGGGWRVQLIAATTVVVAALWQLRTPAFAARTLVSLAAVTFAFTLPLSGHSAGNVVHLGVAGAHVLAAGAWLGTLGILVISRVTNSDRAGQQQTGAMVFQRFSPVAMCGAATVVTSGTVMVWLYLGPLRAILLSGYGRLLTAKLVLFAAVCACGYLNWRRARRGEPLPAARWEVVLTVAIVLVTGFLTESAPP